MRLRMSTRVILAIMRVGLLVLCTGMVLFAQKPCSDTPIYTPCDIPFELTGDETWQTARITAEVKSPRFKTFTAEAFWDGGRKMLIRFTPTDDGSWELKLTSNLQRFDKQLIKVNAIPSEI